MDESIIQNVQDRLKVDKWTRATIGSYSIANFKELDDIIEDASSSGTADALKALCDDHLSHTKNSIIALYISGIIGAAQHIIDESAITELVNIFKDNHKTQVVEYICERALDYGESVFALRTLSECYREENDTEKFYSVCERLVKADTNEADKAKLVAEKYKNEGNTEAAIDYYKKALYRYINLRQFNPAKEIWTRLVAMNPDDFDFFQHVQRKIAKTFSEDRAATVLHELYSPYMHKGDWDTAIGILKQILSYDEKDNVARRELVECFRQKYSNHSMLEEYIKTSSLAPQYARNVFDAILEFEKHIAFDAGNFVFHRTWGVGRISSVGRDELVIDFAKHRGHKMSLKMGVSSLQTLSRDHIWVLKTVWKKDKLKQKVKDDPAWALKTIIKSYGNCCSSKKIKEELVPSVLTAAEWTSWNAKARAILKEDPAFGVNPENIDEHTVRERPASNSNEEKIYEEKIYNEWKAQSDFFAKIDLIMAFYEKGDRESEYFSEMLDYFTSYLKASGQANERTIASYLVVEEIAPNCAQLNSSIFTFKNKEDYAVVYKQIKNSKLQQKFLQRIKDFLPDEWPDIYAKIFPEILAPKIIDDLLDGYEDKVKGIATLCFDNYRNYREAVVWLVSYDKDNEKKNKKMLLENIPKEKQLISLIRILDIAFKEIENHKNTTENKKINRQIVSLLFTKDKLLEKYMFPENADDAAEGSADNIDTITRLYTLVDDVKGLDPAIKMQLKNKILERHKDIKLHDTEEKSETTRGLLVSSRMMTEKQKELRRLIDEEIPENQKELAYALSLGDLRENSEYKAAKERQSMLDNRVRTYQEEIGRAQIVDPSTVSPNRVAFGTVVTLQNNITNEDETLTILGPWESNTDAGVISYLSPLGSKICGSREGENLRFSLNNIERDYTVKSIAVADF